ncbi:MAG: sigma-54-dependent transcriptional regulator [Gemmatimonadales bacterium]
MTLVLVVDDVPALAEQYAYDLRRLGGGPGGPGFETLVAGGGREALETLAREAVDCVILDLEMPGVDGFEVLRTIRQRGLDVPVIVYTGTGSYDRCVQAVRQGADGFIDKAEPMERVLREIEVALERRRLTSEVRALRSRLGVDTSLVGESEPMRRLREAIARVASVPSPVLIEGETGTGKELVARDLHRLGGGGGAAREREPFIALNCAALPENLVESELFGHERGAFTGAAQLRQGAFEAAGRGTLFLDEIGELPGPAQAKLLRVLETNEVTRVGGTRIVAVRARVLAATNRRLEAEVAAGRFRQDLFFRLNVHVLRVPPLRERLSDVPALAEHLLAALCRRLGVRPRRLAPDAIELLMGYDWPKNNVRELRNMLERMIIASDVETLTAADVPPEVRDSGPPPPPGGPGVGARTFLEQKAEAERRILVAALERNDWHISRTARELGLADHSSLLKIMRRHGIGRD